MATLTDNELIPVSAQQRAEYDRWCFFVLSELEQALWTMAKHKFALPAEHRIKQVQETATWEYQRALDILSQGLGKQPYILGDAFSAADILVSHTLIWGIAFGHEPQQQTLLNYLQIQRARPGLARALQREQGTKAGESS